MTENDPWVIDVDARSFEAAVIERSFELPVVLDFHAAWCGPCQTLGPVLEQRARDGAGRFLLAKVDVDANPELAQALRVQGIPAVLAVARGQLVDGFEGALPEDEVDRFLEKVAPAGEATPSVEERARALAEEGKLEEAMALLRDHLRSTPDDHGARRTLADLLVDAERAADARLVFEELPAEERETAEGKALLARIDFAEGSGDLAALRARVEEAPEDFDARVELGKALLAGKDHRGGLEQLLEAVRIAPEGRAQEARAPMLETFELLGLEDPVANEFRFQLSLELFN